MTTTPTPCMGGWCRIRTRCGHYTEAVRTADDADRLCMPGHDGVGVDAPVRIYRPAGSWERAGAGLMAAAAQFDALGAA